VQLFWSIKGTGAAFTAREATYKFTAE